MIMNVVVVISRGELGRVCVISGIGRSREISTSKIRKMTAIRKNRSEKGIRADLIGSNPHSKGDGFSRSVPTFFARRIIRAIRISIIVAVIRKLRVIIRIFDLNFLVLLQL